MHRALLLFTTLCVLAGCAHEKYITVVAPKKSVAEEQAATIMAEHIFPITHERSLIEVQQQLATPKIQGQLKEMVSDKIGNSSLGECLTDYGFSDYFTQRMLADISTPNIRAETIRLWVRHIPMEMFAKADQTMTQPQFKKIYARLGEMGDGENRTKLNMLVEQQEITPSDANEFFLTLEDRDIKSFMLITRHDGKVAVENLLKPYRDNPAAVVLDFMKTHPEANAQCSMVKGSPL